MSSFSQARQVWTRRQLLAHSGLGLGSIALASLLSDDLGAGEKSASDSDPLASRAPHFAPKANSVIFLHMIGGPSQLDLFDDKPALRKHDGQDCPADLLKGQRFAFIRGKPKLLGSKFKFAAHGSSGLQVSELLPNLAKVADDLAVIRTVKTDQFNHAPAQLMLQTGFGRFGRPTFGAWVSYGLGSENQNLPSFVVMNTGELAGAGNSLWGSGFLPTVHQGIEFRSQGDPVYFLSNPPGIAADDRRRTINHINAFNRAQLADVGDPEISTRIEQYEMAFRMQSSVPELMDLSQESPAVHKAYGTSQGKASFANNCLLARRLVERGVRFVQLFDSGWDHHGDIFKALTGKCKQVDQPVAALIADLKQRGLLDQTLVVWGGEFGRTPLLQSDRKKAGRDHHKEAFSMVLAGGGVRGGVTIGETDELGYFAASDEVHVNDLHATLLHLLGLDHTRLTYKYQGRAFRLTDVAGRVVKELVT